MPAQSFDEAWASPAFASCSTQTVPTPQNSLEHLLQLEHPHNLQDHEFRTSSRCSADTLSGCQRRACVLAAQLCRITQTFV